MQGGTYIVSLYSTEPYGASYGLLWGLTGLLSGLTRSTEHPRRKAFRYISNRVSAEVLHAGVERSQWKLV